MRWALGSCSFWAAHAALLAGVLQPLAWAVPACRPALVPHLLNRGQDAADQLNRHVAGLRCRPAIAAARLPAAAALGLSACKAWCWASRAAARRALHAPGAVRATAAAGCPLLRLAGGRTRIWTSWGTTWSASGSWARRWARNCTCRQAAVHPDLLTAPGRAGRGRFGRRCDLPCPRCVQVHGCGAECRLCLRCCLVRQGQLLDELDTEIEGTSTRLQAAQVRVEEAVCVAMGSRGAGRRGCSTVAPCRACGCV